MLSDEEIVLKRLKETLDVLKGKNVIGRLDFQIRDMVEDCIRVIEKQSKEIEELKDDKYGLEEEVQIQAKQLIEIDGNYISKEESEQKERKAYIKGTNDADELCNKKWKDKIKAKIEEVDYKMVAHQDVREAVKQVLQSLLEKE